MNSAWLSILAIRPVRVLRADALMPAMGWSGFCAGGGNEGGDLGGEGGGVGGGRSPGPVGPGTEVGGGLGATPGPSGGEDDGPELDEYGQPIGKLSDINPDFARGLQELGLTPSPGFSPTAYGGYNPGGVEFGRFNPGSVVPGGGSWKGPYGVVGPGTTTIPGTPTYFSPNPVIDMANIRGITPEDLALEAINLGVPVDAWTGLPEAINTFGQLTGTPLTSDEIRQIVDRLTPRTTREDLPGLIADVRGNPEERPPPFVPAPTPPSEPTTPEPPDPSPPGGEGGPVEPEPERPQTPRPPTLPPSIPPFNPPPPEEPTDPTEPPDEPTTPTTPAQPPSVPSFDPNRPGRPGTRPTRPGTRPTITGEDDEPSGPLGPSADVSGQRSKVFTRHTRRNIYRPYGDIYGRRRSLLGAR